MVEAPIPPEDAAVAPVPLPKLVPFLSVVTPVVPPPAPAKGYLHPPPAGFDVRKGGDVFHLPDGDLYARSYPTGPSDSAWSLSLVRSGVEVKAFPQVSTFTVDAAHGKLALTETRSEPKGAIVARELVDLTTLARTPLPTAPCTSTLAFADEGRVLVGHGFVHDVAHHPETSQVWVCLFDATGKLLAKLDGGLHPHHAASADYVNVAVGVLPKEPAVVYLTREYVPYGNYDVTFVDTRPPHARKVARLPTPAEPGQLAALDLDVATTTLAATEVRFRGQKFGDGWWWKWQTAKLVDVP